MTTTTTLFRIDVRTAQTTDSAGETLRRRIAEIGHDCGPISTTRIFLIEAEATPEEADEIAAKLLADPIVERAELIDASRPAPTGARIEIHLKPGVMDPVAASTEMAIRDMGINVNEVRTGRSFLFDRPIDRPILQEIAARLLANGVIETIHFDRYIPDQFPSGHEQPFLLRHVPLRNLSDDAMKKLSREGHLFLSLAEMQAIQNYFRMQEREPTDIELETLAQTWSEHCVHKTLKSAVEVVDETGAVVRRYGNLIKETIFAATEELMNRVEDRVSGIGYRVSGEMQNANAPDTAAHFLNPKPETRNPKPDPFCLSVFKDNAGVIAFDETDAVCFKVETHNHPSAIEPYGGSATGIGGVIRDVLGTGLAAKPIANTNVFCVAYPDRGSGVGCRVSGEMQNANAPDSTSAHSLNPKPETRNPKPDANLPKGVIHPKRVLQQVVAGVRDYGNRMGIPTVNGAVYFDDRYLGNPLVFCGCAGLIPRDKIAKEARPGDAVVLMGGRTGRDGIHGATFSSAELTDTHADEFSHAVQIGNAITEKKVADVILAARDQSLFNAITDLGAGGLSSAVGEMGEKLGAFINLDTVPLKYAGLKYDEIWISEAQERMLLAVPKEHVDALLKLSAGEDVEATVIGHFGTDNRELVLQFREKEVCRLSMEFMHDGLPKATRRAVVKRGVGVPPALNSASALPRGQDSHATKLLELLAHPNIASKHWIIRQYDHEVQGGSVIKPLIGPHQIGPSDAAVVRPKLGSYKGIVLSCGMSPDITDPYAMAIASIDEAIRNSIAIGADPTKLAILDNFCWPSVDDEATMGTLVAACEACRDAALAFGIPFISGKDSLHNQFTNQETGEVLKIPNTLLISAIGVIDDVRKCVTMDLKQAGSSLYLIRPRATDLNSLIETHRWLAAEIAEGKVLSCHDISDGGLLVAAAEMCIAAGLGLQLDLASEPNLFTPGLAEYLVEFKSPPKASDFCEARPLGRVIQEAELQFSEHKLSIDQLRTAWRGTLDW